MTAPAFAIPEPLRSDHRLDEFDSGEDALDIWLKRRALKNQSIGASRSFVICAEKRVIGYYCLSTGALSHSDAPKALTRNMPDPIPILLLGRLAVDRAWRHCGLGGGLLKDALVRAATISENAGVSTILVHALNERARQFYISCGFDPTPRQPLTLIMTLATVRKILAEPDSPRTR